MDRLARPNIVFILADNIGWGDFSVYGGLTATPRIDALANAGIRFNNYNVEAQCTPTRSAILTGRQSVRTGCYTVPLDPHQPYGLAPWEYTLAELLSDAGYATALYGKMAPRCHRGAAADGSRLRRVVGLQGQHGRSRVAVLCDLPRADEGHRWRIAQDLGRQKGRTLESGARSRHRSQTLHGRDDRAAYRGLHRQTGQGGQAVLRVHGAEPLPPT